MDPDLSRIQSLDLELTTRCNLRCDYCYLGRMNDIPRRDMDAATMDDTLALVSRITACSGKALRVYFYGGEPLAAFPAMQDFVHRAEARDIALSWGIVTNGTIANPEMVAWCKQRNFGVQRSIDGCPSAQEVNRPGTSAAYERATKLWQDYARTRRTTVTPQTARYLLDSLHYYAACGFAKGAAFIPDEYADWSPEAAAELMKQLRAMAEEFVRDTKAGKPFWTHWFERHAKGLFESQTSSAGCGAGRTMLGITYEGLVVPCHRFSREPAKSPMCYGCVREVLEGRQKGFGVEWTQRQQAIHARQERPECVSCIGRYGCAKGCYHTCWVVNGDLGKPTAIQCRVHQEAARLTLWIDKQLRAVRPRWWERKKEIPAVAGKNPTPSLDLLTTCRSSLT